MAVYNSRHLLCILWTCSSMQFSPLKLWHCLIFTLSSAFCCTLHPLCARSIQSLLLVCKKKANKTKKNHVLYRHLPLYSLSQIYMLEGALESYARDLLFLLLLTEPLSQVGLQGGWVVTQCVTVVVCVGRGLPEHSLSCAFHIH